MSSAALWLASMDVLREKGKKDLAHAVINPVQSY